MSADDARKRSGKLKLSVRLARLREEFRQGKYEVDALRLIQALARADGIRPS